MVETSRTISCSVLERKSISPPSGLRKFFVDTTSRLEFRQKDIRDQYGSGYSITLHIPFLNSSLSYPIGDFEDELSGKEAYEKILSAIRDGGRIDVSFISSPIVSDSKGKEVKITKEFPRTNFGLTDSIGE